MSIVHPGRLHRLALAVEDANQADAWFKATFGAGSVYLNGQERSTGVSTGADADLAGTEMALFRVGGFPFIVLAKGEPGGPVASFLQRYGPGVHSLAWEVDDMWTVQNLLIEHGIRIGAVNIPGRHFFMHPKDTHSVLMEWTDDTFGENGRQADEGGGLVDALDLAWVTALVTDAEATAAFLADLADATEVDGNAKGPGDRETTLDMAVGDITVRLVTPRSEESPYAPMMAKGPRLCTYALRVGDLDATLKALEGAGVPTVRRDGDLAATDPAATFGIPMEWTV
jgi:catechol 2,3-dioxygenase-like lactoylglutathione lyase family enzyme